MKVVRREVGEATGTVGQAADDERGCHAPVSGKNSSFSPNCGSCARCAARRRAICAQRRPPVTCGWRGSDKHGVGHRAGLRGRRARDLVGIRWVPAFAGELLLPTKRALGQVNSLLARKCRAQFLAQPERVPGPARESPRKWTSKHSARLLSSGCSPSSVLAMLAQVPAPQRVLAAARC